MGKKPPNPSKNDEPHPDSKGDKSESRSPNEPPVSPIDVKAHAPDRSNDQQCPKRDTEWIWKRAEIIGIFVAIFVSLMGVIINFWFANRQLEAIGDQQQVMKDQLAAMNDETRATRDSFQLVQRAFIAVSELRVSNSPDNSDIALTPLIRNTGTTAARNVTIVMVNPQWSWGLPHQYPRQTQILIDWKVGAPSDPEDLIAFPGNASVVRFDRLTIPPTGGLSASDLTVTLPPNAGMLAQQNTIGRFLYGVITYDDIYRVHHLSKFCFRIDGILLNGKHTSQLQSICRHWNCTDDDCAADKDSYEADVRQAIGRTK